MSCDRVKSCLLQTITCQALAQTLKTYTKKKEKKKVGYLLEAGAGFVSHSHHYPCQTAYPVGLSKTSDTEAVFLTYISPF